MQKARIYVANWKMNMHLDSGLQFANDCKALMNDNENTEKQGSPFSQNGAKKHIILCPTFPAIYPIAQLLQNVPISIGAQNCSEHEIGAYTGEVSAQSLSEIGCSYCIIGHSERRKYFHETNEVIARKVVKLFASTINPIICIGETAQDHKDNKTLEVLEHQLNPIIKAINEAEQFPETVIFAYEPVWAIGTGKTPNNETLHATFNWLAAHLTRNIKNIKVIYLLYGGSVDEHTALEMVKVQNIDGFLIGGASLDFQKFKNIVSLA